MLGPLNVTIHVIGVTFITTPSSRFSPSFLCLGIHSTIYLFPLHCRGLTCHGESKGRMICRRTCMSSSGLCESWRWSGWVSIFCGSIVGRARINMIPQSLAQTVLVKSGLATHDSEYIKRFKSLDQGPYRATTVKVLVSAILQTHMGVLHGWLAAGAAWSVFSENEPF